MGVSSANFKSLTSVGVGTSNTQVGGYSTPNGSQSIVLNLTCSNKTSNAVSVSVFHANGSANTMVANGVVVPAGDTFFVNKIVLMGNCSLYVVSSAASSVDAMMSIVELT